MYGMHALRSMLGGGRGFPSRRTITTLLALAAAVVALAPRMGATDTNIVTQLTADLTNCSRRAVVSADGSVVAFESQADLVSGQNPDGTAEIFVVNSDGTGLRQITDDLAPSHNAPASASTALPSLWWAASLSPGRSPASSTPMAPVCGTWPANRGPAPTRDRSAAMGRWLGWTPAWIS